MPSKSTSPWPASRTTSSRPPRACRCAARRAPTGSRPAPTGCSSDSLGGADVIGAGGRVVGVFGGPGPDTIVVGAFDRSTAKGGRGPDVLRGGKGRQAVRRARPRPRQRQGGPGPLPRRGGASLRGLRLRARPCRIGVQLPEIERPVPSLARVPRPGPARRGVRVRLGVGRPNPSSSDQRQPPGLVLRGPGVSGGSLTPSPESFRSED